VPASSGSESPDSHAPPWNPGTLETPESCRKHINSLASIQSINGGQDLQHTELRTGGAVISLPISRSTSSNSMLSSAVMWSETVGLRKRPVWDQKNRLGLGVAGLVLWNTVLSRSSS